VIEAEKKAILVALTLGGYQKQRYIRHPGLGSVQYHRTPGGEGKRRFDWQESSFGDSEKYSTHDEAFIGRHCGGAAGDDTPWHHDPRDPSGRGKVFHGDVGWEFEQNIRTG
jgi:hypothetical protein